jgi:hypothetical protein
MEWLEAREEGYLAALVTRFHRSRQWASSTSEEVRRTPPSQTTHPGNRRRP